MREQKQEKGLGQGRYGWRDLKQDLGDVAALLAFLAVILGIVALPGLMTDSASTVPARMTRAAHR